MTNGTKMRLGTVVELRTPARNHQVAVLRDVAENIAVRNDFDLDSVSDIKMAADEVASVLVSRARGDATLISRYRMVGDELRVSMWAAIGDTPLPTPHSFSWHVLTSLTDNVTGLAYVTASREEKTAKIEFTKRRRGPR